MYVCTHMQAYIHTSVGAYVHVYKDVCMYACNMQAWPCMYVETCVNFHTCTYTFTERERDLYIYIYSYRYYIYIMA